MAEQIQLCTLLNLKLDWGALVTRNSFWGEHACRTWIQRLLLMCVKLVTGRHVEPCHHDSYISLKRHTLRDSHQFSIVYCCRCSLGLCCS
eukprot:scaffold97041_cov38-Prasinocladus_malaysianus.AAC.1